MSTTDITTTETKQQKEEHEADEAHAILSLIKAAIKDGRAAVWRLAEGLYEFHEVRGWQTLGYDSLKAFLADPEITLTESTYHRYIAVFRTLVIERGVERERAETLDVTKVDIVLPALNAGRITTEDAVAKVEANGAQDLREEFTKKPSPNVGSSGKPKTPNVADLDAHRMNGHEPDLEPEVIDGKVVDEPEPSTSDGARMDREAADDLTAKVLATETVLAELEALPWGEVEAADASNAPYPRMDKGTYRAFMAFREKYLPKKVAA
jgi:hypothetical protein